MRSAESAGSVSILEPPGSSTASAADEAAKDRNAAARRTRMGTPSGKIQGQASDSGTPGLVTSLDRRCDGFEEPAARVRGQKKASRALCVAPSSTETRRKREIRPGPRDAW